MSDRIAIVDGIRTPMAKAGTVLKNIQADDLGAWVLRELRIRSKFPDKPVDEVIMGCVAQPVHAANVARVISLKAGFDKSVPAFTVHRNCASGIESVVDGWYRIRLGVAQHVIAGGVESMSNIPLLYNKEMTGLFEKLMKAKSIGERLSALGSFRPRYLKPVIGLLQGLTDPICGEIMGMTAENLAREFYINRDEQDQFALESHQKAAAAIEAGAFKEEVMACPIPGTNTVFETDNGPRENQSMEALAKLKPYFDRKNGTVTVGTSSQVTDAAAGLVLAPESWVKSEGIKPLGYIKAAATAGCDPSRMGLGPVYATHKVFKETGLGLKDMGIIEMNEAFAAQVLANVKAFASREFAEAELGTSEPLGEIDPAKLNPQGGAIALGHPLGMTGTRLILTTLKQMQANNLEYGLATCCIGGGQGSSMILEAAE